MTASKSWALVVTGYGILAAAMLAFLTINGLSSTPAGTITTASLLVLGLMLPAAGMLQLARRPGRPHGAARNGLILQALGLIGLVIGFVLSFAASSTSGYLASAVFIVLSGVMGLAGAILISKQARARLLVTGAALIGIGALLIPASNIALLAGWLLDLDKNIYEDIGATLAAGGCVMAAYSFFVLRSRAKAPAVSLP